MAGASATTLATAPRIDAAMAALKTAERPLVIVGKGAAYSRAEDEVRQFLEATQLPYLASPMGKGVMPDDHPLSIAPARCFGSIRSSAAPGCLGHLCTGS